MLLSSRRCPHTGVVNFYAETEPHFSIGCIASCGTSAETPTGFTWRCYSGSSEISGRAPDLRTAERRLVNFYAMVEQTGAGDQRRV
jgi:hypothetical protein